jgi:short-subunit dehydrogenase
MSDLETAADEKEPKMPDTENMVVVITGASSGIGRATALEFARPGVSLALAARKADALEQTVAECAAMGAQAIAVPTDMTEQDAVDALAIKAIAEFGRIDVWVNDAAVGVFGRFEQIPMDDFRRAVETDLFGYVYGARAAIRQFREQGYGTLVNMASIVGRTGQPYASPYVVSKAGVIALSESLRQELVDEPRIRVSSVIPTSVDTPFSQHAADFYGAEPKAMPPVYKAQDVAKAVVQLIERPKPEVYVGFEPRKLSMMRSLSRRLFDRLYERQVRERNFQDVPAFADSGILFEPGQAEHAISGGWSEEQDGSKRWLWMGVAAAAASGGAYAAWRLARHRKRSGLMRGMGLG